MIRILAVLAVGFVVYSCAFGAMSGYKSASEPKVTNYVTNTTSYDVLSHNEFLSHDSANAQIDGSTILIFAGVALTAIVTLGGKKGGGHE